MEFNQFVEKTKKAIQEYLGEDTTVMRNQVTKNNGVILEGLSIVKKEKNISPTIYLNQFYEAYEDGTTFGEIIKNIINIYEQNKIEENINMEFFTDYSQVRKKIVYKLINYDKNSELLADIPHVKYLDLAIVFYCIVMNEQIRSASILIHNKHCEMWDVTAEDIYTVAKENTPRLLPSELRNMEEVIRQIVSENLQSKYMDSNEADSNETDSAERYSVEEYSDTSTEWIDDAAEQMIENSKEENKVVPMYVLSNQTRVHGAACMLYQGVMSKFAEDLQKDFYILPSSIHEIILIPVEYSDNPME